MRRERKLSPEKGEEEAIGRRNGGEDTEETAKERVEKTPKKGWRRHQRKEIAGRKETGGRKGADERMGEIGEMNRSVVSMSETSGIRPWVASRRGRRLGRKGADERMGEIV